jgi:hypothetical protein
MFQIFGTPVINAKFHTPLSLLYLGFCAWFLFRTLGFSQVVCVLGALAAALNMNPFSHATWGLPSRALTWGSALLAIAALYSGGVRGRPIIKAILAGMCVGLGIVEGFDVGALYSLYIAAFGLFVAIAIPSAPGPKPRLFAIGAVRVAVVAISSAIFAAHALNVLISTQVQGIEGLKQDTESIEKRWDQATGWSLPKAETLRVIIPGVFGYRMDTPEGGYYWGSVGFPAFAPRHSGAGEYAGILVVLVGIWGAANAFRKTGSLYTVTERKVVLFWTVAAVVSILFAWGRWAPFYKLIYGLPFFSTIRNPIKFMHFFHLSLLILFGYGLQLLIRNYAGAAKETALGFKERFQSWWAAAVPFERKVVLALSVGLIISFLGFLFFSSSRPSLEKHLITAGFPEPYNKEIAAFSQGEVGKYLVVYIISFAAILMCLCGALKARTAAIVFGVILAADLGRANLPWIKYVDYKAKYGPKQSVIDLLAKDPLEHRVTAKFAPFSGAYFSSEQIRDVFNDWLQTLFQYNNIQSLDIIQFPRVPELDAAYSAAFMPTNEALFPRAARLWELSNTRYILGQPQYVQDLNSRFDPGKARFRVLTNFSPVPKPGLPAGVQPTINDVTWELGPNGPLGIIEFTGAMPRYKLFSAWEQSVNDTNTLSLLVSPDFDPHTRLLINDASIASSTNTTTTNAGTVQVVSYAPKRIQVKVDAAANSILLWNDRWSPNWKATVDGQPVNLLRANFIMRGIQVPAGSHEIVMRYEQPAKYLYVSFAMMAVGVLLCAFLGFESRKKQ